MRRDSPGVTVFTMVGHGAPEVWALGARDLGRPPGKLRVCEVVASSAYFARTLNAVQ